MTNAAATPALQRRAAISEADTQRPPGDGGATIRPSFGRPRPGFLATRPRPSPWRASGRRTGIVRTWKLKGLGHCVGLAGLLAASAAQAEGPAPAVQASAATKA